MKLKKALQALAADTIVERPEDYPLRLRVKSLSLGMKMGSLLEKGKMVAATLLRVSFGMSFVASCVVGSITWGLLAVLEAIGEGKVLGHSLNLFFSFVFGDGDLNQGNEENRWKMIGQCIALNGGVVTAEELAPYLDPETTKKMDDDSFMLPVLQRFDGQPKVDEQGHILYHFPSIQCFAAPQRVVSGKQVQNFLKEKKWEFSSEVDRGGFVFVFFFVTHNLIWSVIWLLKEDCSVVDLSNLSCIFLPLLRMYAVFVGSFFVIATFRWFACCERNAQVVKRNQAREKLAKALEKPDLSLKQKILSARSLAGVWEMGE